MTTDIQTTANADGYTLTVFARGRCVHKTTARYREDELFVDELADDYNRENLSPELDELIYRAENVLSDVTHELRRLQP